MKSKIRILVAEDHVIARAGVISILNLQPDMVVVAEAVNGQQALELFLKHRPDVILLDIRMPIMSGVEAAIAIWGVSPQARMIALSSYGGEEDVRRTLAVGIHGYLTKDVPPEELTKAIRVVHSGGTYLPAALGAMLASQPEHQTLTVREIQVLELLARGLADKQIAHVLHIAESTASNHVRNIRGKLGVGDRTEAATTAIQRGIIHM